MSTLKITKTNRKINYFELHFSYEKDKKFDDIKSTFSNLIQLSKSKSPKRFVINNEKQLYITSIKFEKTNKRISGRLLNIRMDSFPELMDTSDDTN